MRAVECTFAFICARGAYNHLLLHFSRSSMFCYFSNHYIYRITNITQNNFTQVITNNPQITERFGVAVTPLMLFSCVLDAAMCKSATVTSCCGCYGSFPHVPRCLVLPRLLSCSGAERRKAFCQLRQRL